MGKRERDKGSAFYIDTTCCKETTVRGKDRLYQKMYVWKMVKNDGNPRQKKPAKNKEILKEILCFINDKKEFSSLQYI